DPVDPAVGFVIPVKPGDQVRAGDLLGTVHARDAATAAAGAAALQAAIVLADGVTVTPLVSHRVSASGIEVLA
ncbi:MAG: thymidine phosphorylase, partial [Gemmatimonadales bacterium]|nr:thymidine phosphorylase [Gemmatimonadales bacterium]